jgi:hypothetical protein
MDVWVVIQQAGRTLGRVLPLAAATTMAAVYLAHPLWPRVLAEVPWHDWASAAFLLVATALCLSMSRNKGAKRAIALTAALVLYLFAEITIFLLVYPSPNKHPLDAADYLFASSIISLSHLPVVLIFGIYCLSQAALLKYEDKARSQHA